MASHHFGVFFLLFLGVQAITVQSRSLKATTGQSLESLQNLEGIQKGETAKGVAAARSYFKAFGYYNSYSVTEDDEFDEGLESAIKAYQKFYKLKVSGKLDAETTNLMSLSRCGVPDPINLSGSNTNTVSKYSFDPEKLRWPDSKTRLTYSFQSAVEVEPLEVMRKVAAMAFRVWSSVSQFTFEEAASGANSDLVIGFFRGDHGDGLPFDGRGKIVAHAFLPTDGRLHFDADELWSTDVPPPPGYYDLVWAAIHEIGHLLGLTHSTDRNAIMYAIMDPGVNRRALGADDIAGIRALYSLPNLQPSVAVALRWDCYLLTYTFAVSLCVSLFPNCKFIVL